MEPLELMARLTALVPPPRMHLTRYHGVFPPHSRLRAAVTPAGRGLEAPKPAAQAGEASSPAMPRHVAMSWARRLKRVFGVEIEACARCGGKLRVRASIEDPEVIARILAHLDMGSRWSFTVAAGAAGSTGSAIAAKAALTSQVTGLPAGSGMGGEGGSAPVIPGRVISGRWRSQGRAQ
jgi:hypothetical protein